MVSFDSKLLPEGNLYCPKEFTKKKNVHFKVIVVFDESDIELSAIKDNSIDFLSREELDYYLNLERL
jgi:hypothetical protein